MYKLISSHLFSTLAEDSVPKLFPKEITDKMDPATANDIQD